MPVGKYTITANSAPDYDEWGYDDYWDSSHWIAWHKAMVKEFGKKKAGEIWKAAWAYNSDFLKGLGDVRGDFIFNNEFKDYTKKEKLFDAVADNIALGNLMSSGHDLVTGVSKITTNVSKAAVNTSKFLKWGVVIVLMTLIVLATMFAYKKYVKRA